MPEGTLKKNRQESLKSFQGDIQIELQDIPVKNSEIILWKNYNDFFKLISRSFSKVVLGGVPQIYLKKISAEISWEIYQKISEASSGVFFFKNPCKNFWDYVWQNFVTTGCAWIICRRIARHRLTVSNAEVNPTHTFQWFIIIFHLAPIEIHRNPLPESVKQQPMQKSNSSPVLCLEMASTLSASNSLYIRSYWYFVLGNSIWH